jgi:hypothetical protein
MQCTVGGVEGDRELERCGVKIGVFVERGAVMCGDISNIDMRHILTRQQNDRQTTDTYTLIERLSKRQTNCLAER